MRGKQARMQLQQQQAAPAAEGDEPELECDGGAPFEEPKALEFECDGGVPEAKPAKAAPKRGWLARLFSGFGCSRASPADVAEPEAPVAAPKDVVEVPLRLEVGGQLTLTITPRA
eukprot:5253102-Prymnesium_polylepis.1